MAYSFLIFLLISLLQKLIRFFNEVGLAYQSPPPLYFKIAILYVGSEKLKIKTVNNDNNKYFFFG